MNYVIPCFILLTQISVFNSQADQKAMVNANKILIVERGIVYFDRNKETYLKVKESAAEIKSLIKNGCDK